MNEQKTLQEIIEGWQKLREKRQKHRVQDGTPYDRPVGYQDAPPHLEHFKLNAWLEVQDGEHMGSVSVATIVQQHHRFLQLDYEVEVKLENGTCMEHRCRWYQYDDPHLHAIDWHVNQTFGPEKKKMKRVGRLPDGREADFVPSTAFRTAKEHNLKEGSIFVLAARQWNEFTYVHVVKDGPNDLHSPYWFKLRAGTSDVTERFPDQPMYFHIEDERLMPVEFAIANDFDIIMEKNAKKQAPGNKDLKNRYEEFVRNQNMTPSFVECCGLEMVGRDRKLVEPNLEFSQDDPNLFFLTLIIVMNNNCLAQKACSVPLTNNQTIWYSVSGEREMRHCHRLNPWLFPGELVLDPEAVEFQFNAEFFTIRPETPPNMRNRRNKTGAGGNEPVVEKQKGKQNNQGANSKKAKRLKKKATAKQASNGDNNGDNVDKIDDNDPAQEDAVAIRQEAGPVVHRPKRQRRHRAGSDSEDEEHEAAHDNAVPEPRGHDE